MTTALSPESKTRAHPSRRATCLYSVILTLLFGCGLLFLFIRQKAATPLGASLSLPTATATRQDALTKIPAMNQLEPQGVQVVKSAPDPTSSTPTQAAPPPQPVCGGPASMLILAVGADANNYLYGLSDVIRIARVDFVHASITVVSLPRDLWVEIPGIEDHYGITHGKLNQAYLFGNPGMGYYDGPAGGPGLLARTIQQNYGLAVDHYVAADMETFVHIIDALGGIDINLPQDVDGGTLDGGVGSGYFRAGLQHLSGEQALRLSRIRMKYNDSKRRDNQSLVLEALTAKLLTPAVFVKIPQLVDAFRGSVLIDLSPEQIVQLTCLLRTAGQDHLALVQLPDDLYSHGWVYSDIFKAQTNIVEADPQAIQDYLQRFAAGEWP